MNFARLSVFWFWEPWIEDDRARGHDVPRQNPITDAHGVPDWFFSLHDSYRRRLVSRASALFWNLLLAIPVGIGAGAIWAGPSPQVKSPSIVLVILGIFLLASQGLRVGMRVWWRKGYRDSLREAMSTYDLCGLCGFHAHALDREPDGCTVCPECGAAWRIEHDQPGSRD